MRYSSSTTSAPAGVPRPATRGRLSANPVVDLSPERGPPASLGNPWMGAAKVGGIYYAISAGADGIGLVTGTIGQS